MDFNIETKENKAEAGDLIELPDYSIHLICKDNFGIYFLIVLRDKRGEDTFKISDRDSPNHDQFKEGNYKIIAKCNEWEINRK